MVETDYLETIDKKFLSRTGKQSENRGKPFLKWAGGKTQMLPSLTMQIPDHFGKYIEPFIGGGAFFFHLNPAYAVISDSNDELIITYQVVRDQVEELIEILSNYKNDEAFFYYMRSKEPELLTKTERAARLIFLNKTCYNGLYRVNKSGAFNVPFGKRTSEFLNRDLLREASNALTQVEIIHADYQWTLRHYAQKNDFIFLDPPYYPVGKFADFKRYTKEFFYHEDHLTLKQEFDRLVALGCHVMLTNSDHPFIMDLYKEYRIIVVETKRLISSNPMTRNGKDIIVIGTHA